MIIRFRTILTCIASCCPINLSAFQRYLAETVELYVREYSWYYMPVTVHKVLFHGKEIISTCILPIGNFSEEAQEARNKEVRSFREHFTRKTSRIHTNTDLMLRLLISSDPFIASLRAPPKTRHLELPEDVTQLLSQDGYSDDSCDSDSE